MKIIFAGTPIFAATALKSIVEAGHEVVLVLTQPDRPSGRGLKLQQSAVKEYALSQNISVEQPISLKLNGKYPEIAEEIHEKVKNIEHDIMVVAAYGLILPGSFLNISPKGCINIHGSLLPRWRGAAPIQRCIEAGDNETGNTIMLMDEGLDTGDMLLIKSIPIENVDNAETLHDKLAVLGSSMIVEALNDIDNLIKNKVKQPLEGMNYAEKLTKEEGNLNLSMNAKELELKIRAFNPYPCASIELEGVKVKVWSAQYIKEITGLPGQVVFADKTNGLVIACGEGGLKLNELQKTGAKRMSAKDFMNGHNLINKVFI